VVSSASVSGPIAETRNSEQKRLDHSALNCRFGVPTTMNQLPILEDKLQFLHAFYQLTTEPFREIKRKIEAGKEPFVDGRDPEDYDEPPFLSEWQDADQGLKLQQQVCLNLLQRSFREFLDTTVRQCGGKPQKSKKGENWFDTYKTWFHQERGITWEKAPVSLDRMEELTFARNCIQHGGQTDGSPGAVLDSHSLLKRQSIDYHDRFPDAFFADEFEKQLWREQHYSQPVTIDLTPEKLEVSIGDIVVFCKFIHDALWES
jgi:hypothetical protein